MDPATVATQPLDAFNDEDNDRVRRLLAPELVAWMTSSEGVAELVTGAEAYLDRIAAMNRPSVSYRVLPTQSPVAVEDRVTEWRMADAKPAKSDRFWA